MPSAACTHGPPDGPCIFPAKTKVDSCKIITKQLILLINDGGGTCN